MKPGGGFGDELTKFRGEGRGERQRVVIFIYCTTSGTGARGRSWCQRWWGARRGAPPNESRESKGTPRLECFILRGCVDDVVICMPEVGKAGCP